VAWELPSITAVLDDDSDHRPRGKHPEPGRHGRLQGIAGRSELSRRGARRGREIRRSIKLERHTPDALWRITERFDEIAAKGSTRLQQTVAASLAAELQVEGNRMRATAWRH
jgi:hypothetical protein